jgi:hypothetical protein
MRLFALQWTNDLGAVRRTTAPSVEPAGTIVGTKNASGSVQNQRVPVALAIRYQVGVSCGKGLDERR